MGMLRIYEDEKLPVEFYLMLVYEMTLLMMAPALVTLLVERRVGLVVLATLLIVGMAARRIMLRQDGDNPYVAEVSPDDL